ncbi:MAG: helix-hairpin-helix domain-containing protein [Pseudonocardiaceae bacterium]
MVLFPSIESAASGDPTRVQARLVALRRAPDPGPDIAGPDPADPDPAGPDPAGPDPTGSDPTGSDMRDDPPSTRREGRLVRRWVPGPLRDARWDPGRPGALMLSLVAALAAVIAAVGVWRDRPVPVPAPTLPLVAAAAADPTAANPAASSSAAAPELVVSVVGRVARPGLVQLTEGARVADALDAAGGVLPDTDLVGLNLARRLADGEQLLVGVPPPPGQPADGGAGGAPAGAAGGAPGGGARAGTAVDLNTATLEQLDALPGVGPVTAQRILDWRAAHGRFTSVDQLREVSGIGEARFARLKDLVRV